MFNVLFFRFLEESLSLMKYEFEQMENHWNRKLENERKLYEEQIDQNEKTILKMQLKMENVLKQLSTSSTRAWRGKHHSDIGEATGQNTRKKQSFKFYSYLVLSFLFI
jgi:hypothetical protein